MHAYRDEYPAEIISRCERAIYIFNDRESLAGSEEEKPRGEKEREETRKEVRSFVEETKYTRERRREEQGQGVCLSCLQSFVKQV